MVVLYSRWCIAWWLRSQAGYDKMGFDQIHSWLLMATSLQTLLLSRVGITFIWNLHITIHHSMRTLLSNQFPINKQGLKLAVLQKGIKSLSDSLQLSLVILSLKINYIKAGSNSQVLKMTSLQVGTSWKKTLNAGNYCRGTFGSELIKQAIPWLQVGFLLLLIPLETFLNTLHYTNRPT